MFVEFLCMRKLRFVEVVEFVSFVLGWPYGPEADFRVALQDYGIVFWNAGELVS